MTESFDGAAELAKLNLTDKQQTTHKKTASVTDDQLELDINFCTDDILNDSNTLPPTHNNTLHTSNSQSQQYYNYNTQSSQPTKQRRSRKPEFTTRLVVAEQQPKYFSLANSINESPINPDIRILVQKGREFYIHGCRDPKYINPIAEQGWNSRLNVNTDKQHNSPNHRTTEYLKKHSRAPLSPFLAAMHGYDVPAELYMSEKQRRQYYAQLEAAGVDIQSLQQQTQQYHNELYTASQNGSTVDPNLHFSYWRTVDETALLAEQAGIQVPKPQRKVTKLKQRETGWNERFVVEKALDKQAEKLDTKPEQKSYLQHYLQNSTHMIPQKSKSKKSNKLADAGQSSIKFYDQREQKEPHNDTFVSIG